MVKTIPKWVHKGKKRHFYTIGVLCSQKRIVVILIVKGVFYNGILKGKVIGCMDREFCNAQKGCFVNRSITTLLNRDREDFKRLM